MYNRNVLPILLDNARRLDIPEDVAFYEAELAKYESVA